MLPMRFMLTVCCALGLGLALVEAVSVKKFTKAEFHKAIKEKDHLVVFYVEWCGYCTPFIPVLDEIADQFRGKVEVGKIDCEEEPDLCTKYVERGYPVIYFFKAGNKENKVKYKGVRDKAEVIRFLDDQLKEASNTSENETDDASKPPIKGKLIELTEDDFAKHVSSGNHFVKFYAPWCSHCQRLAPTWEELAKSLQDYDTVNIAKIDCTLHRSICQDFEIKGYPTLLWIEDGKKIEKYAGSRDHDALKAYVEKMVGSEVPVCPLPAKQPEKEKKEEPKKEVLQLTADKFAKTVEDGITFVKFYAPWCGHCQKLSPIWDQLAEKVHTANNGVTIAKVDCTAVENKNLCVEQEVEGYPTLFAYKSGEKQSEYHGSRSLVELQNYINKFVGHDEL